MPSKILFQPLDGKRLAVSGEDFARPGADQFFPALLIFVGVVERDHVVMGACPLQHVGGGVADECLAVVEHHRDRIDGVAGGRKDLSVEVEADVSQPVSPRTKMSDERAK